MKSILTSRFTVFLLASLSFACLLGEFYGAWKMRPFACYVLAPATLLLIYIASTSPRGENNARTWIVQGAIGGVIAAIAYDIYRVPFVMHGYPLFGVFPKFGQMLLGTGPNDYGFAVQAIGWIYHFSNGAALGIMFLAMLVHPTRKNLLWGAIAMAVGVETILLFTPYSTFFKIAMGFFTFFWLTMTAHIIFGIALGSWLRTRRELTHAPRMA